MLLLHDYLLATDDVEAGGQAVGCLAACHARAEQAAVDAVNVDGSVGGIGRYAVDAYCAVGQTDADEVGVARAGDGERYGFGLTRPRVGGVVPRAAVGRGRELVAAVVPRDGGEHLAFGSRERYGGTLVDA